MDTTNDELQKINVILCGQIGVGKTTLVNVLNKKHNYNVYNFCDNMTNDTNDTYVNYADINEHIFNNNDSVYIIIDCDPSVIKNRMTNDKKKNIYSTDKSLHYFRQRYKELSAYYGIPIVNSSGTIDDTVSQVMYALENRSELELYSVRYLTPKVISDNDIEKYLFKVTTTTTTTTNNDNDNDNDNDEYFECAKKEFSIEWEKWEKWDKCDIDRIGKDLLYNLKKTLCARHLCKNGDMQICHDGVVLFKFVDEVNDIVHRQIAYTSLTKPRFRLVYEGKNKKVYVPLTGNRLLKNICFIVSKTKMFDSNELKLYIEMMDRNGICHIYNAINDKVISAEYISPYPKININVRSDSIVKKSCNNVYNVYNEYTYIFEDHGLTKPIIADTTDTTDTTILDISNNDIVTKLFKVLCYYCDRNIAANIHIDNEKICHIYVSQNLISTKSLLQYFTKHKFCETEMLQPYVLYSNTNKLHYKWPPYCEKYRCFVQLEISRAQPVFPMGDTSKFKEMNIKQIMDFLSIGIDIIIHDSDHDFYEFESNEDFLHNNMSEYYYYLSGGIDEKSIIKENIKGIFVSEDGILTGFNNYDSDSDSDSGIGNDSDSDKEEFINMLKKLPANKVIIDINIGYNANKTDINIECFKNGLKTFKTLGIDMIRLTIDSCEKIDQESFRSFVLYLSQYMVGQFSTIIISSSLIRTFDDLLFLWSIKGVCPGLNDIIWTNVIKYEDVIVSMTNFDSNGLVPICIQDTNKQVKGVIYANSNTLKKIVKDRIVYSYNKYDDKTEIFQCQNINNTYNVLQFMFSQDNSSILLTTNSNDSSSIFDKSTNIIENTSSTINTINNNLKDKSNYVKLSHIWDNYLDITGSNEGDYENKVKKSSEIIFDMLCTFANQNIKWEDVLKNLNTLSPKSVQQANSDYVVIGIDINAHKFSVDSSDKYIKEHLGIEIQRSNLHIGYTMCDQEKYEIYFGTKQVKFIEINCKDVFHYIENGLIDYCVTYNVIINNYPLLADELHNSIIHELRLCLVKRKQDNFNIREWTIDSKPKIISEYSLILKSYLSNELYLDAKCYDIIKCTGSSVNILVNNDKYLIADSIVYTDNEWIKENDLSIWKTVVKSGQITIGLYKKNVFNLEQIHQIV
jgi:hypothetical protein